jgi:hypothetical protein
MLTAVTRSTTRLLTQAVYGDTAGPELRLITCSPPTPRSRMAG